MPPVGRRSRGLTESEFPDITWEHSHVVRTSDGMRTYCVYAAPSVERVKAHAAAAGLPAHEVFELLIDVDPADL